MTVTKTTTTTKKVKTAKTGKVATPATLATPEDATSLVEFVLDLWREDLLGAITPRIALLGSDVGGELHVTWGEQELEYDLKVHSLPR